MSIAGRTLYRLRQWRERRRYQDILQNGDEVYRQKQIDDAGGDNSIINSLDFIDGPTFKISDGPGAAYIFHEIFLRDQYPKRLLRAAHTIVDVGSNIGLFSYYARLHAPHARILAFEADPTTFAIMDENLADQDIARFHRAVASQSGTIDFYSSPTSGWSSLYPVLGAANARRVVVKAEPLSQALHGIDKIDFLKIDVEGAEYDILLGDKALWDIPIRNLVVEVDRAPRDPRYTISALLDLLRKKFQSVSIGSGDYPLIIARNAS